MGYDISTVEPMSEADQKALDDNRRKIEEVRALLESIKDEAPSGEPDKDIWAAAVDKDLPLWEARNEASPVKGSDDWARLSRLYDEVVERSYTLDKSYFRANIGGMGFLRETMWRAGMAVDSDDPEWPEAEGFDWGAYEEAKYGDGEMTPEMIAYDEAHRAVRSAHMSDSPGLPLHKFGSNDGWVVTPDEIADALRQADLGAAKARIDVRNLHLFWQRWLDYLAYAQEHGGFEVW